jgi:hypothetical protein
MSAALRVYVEGVGLWSPQLANFAALAASARWPATMPAGRRCATAAMSLPPNERRRAPESVLLAVEVAGQAVAMSGRDAANWPASSPRRTATRRSPITCARRWPRRRPSCRRPFHNSVHNAPAGYWTIATHCHAGPLGEMTATTGPFAIALVLSPRADAGSRTPRHHAFARKQRQPAHGDAWLDGVAASNPSAQAIPLAHALALARSTALRVAAARELDIHVDVEVAA